MKLIFTLLTWVCFTGILCLQAQQPIPELLYYNFNQAGTSVPNLASNPPAGTNTATILGGISQGGTGGVCNSGALIGSGVSSSTDYLNTGWAPALGNSPWSIAFRCSNITPSTTLFYIFGDANSTSFRCFTNGIAGANNWILRGAGLTDVSINGGATVAPHYCAFVFDSAAGVVRAYLDGILVSTVNQGTLNLTGTGPFKVMGYSANVGAPAGGLLDEYRFYSRALTDAEVASLTISYTTSTIDEVVCNGSTYTSPSGNYVWNTPGTYLDTIPNAAGCDSIITINLSVGNPSSSSLSPSVCSSYTSPSGLYTWTTSGVYADTLVNSEGCDSVITINLTVNNTSSVLNASACISFLSPSTLYQWTSSGTYNDTIPNSVGCDSIITVNLTIYQPSTASVNEFACSSYTSPSGKLVTVAGTFNDTIPNSFGCDSIITISLTLGNSSSYITLNGCSSVTSPSGKILTASGAYQDTIANSAGCDSIIAVQVVLQNSASSLTVSACNAYTSPSGKIFTASGTYSDTLPNSAGCDSVISIQLSINANASSLTASACNTYTSPSGKIFTASGTYSDTIPNSAGCDSVITIQLTINTVNTGVTLAGTTLTAAASGAVYQWLNCATGAVEGSGQSFTPATTGSYRVVVTQGNCTDTSACNSVTIVGIETTSLKRILRIFPNPAADDLTVELPEQIQAGRLMLYTLDGTLLTEQDINHNGPITLHVANMANGAYLVSVVHQNEVYNGRFIKQ